MDLRPIVAAAPEVALRGTVLRLVQQQGINSLEPLVDNLEQLARPYAVDPVSAVVSTGGCSTDRAAAAAAWWRVLLLAYGPSQQLGAWMRDHRQITPLSSVTTTASCIVLGASCF
jgi:hypothetical protein